MFLAGVPYRDIGRHAQVRLSAQGVHNVVVRMMAKGARRRGLLEDDAFDIHQERTETLLAANWPKALAGDVRAAELCRRVLDQQARLHGLNARARIELLSQPIADIDDDDDEGHELEDYRRRRAEAEQSPEAMSAYSRECDEQVMRAERDRPGA
jgi:hypothetical protein